jgi:RNA polymerase sigma factor (TIGR02999 family)
MSLPSWRTSAHDAPAAASGILGKTAAPMVAPPPTQQQATQILLEFADDGPKAAARLMPLVYDELRQMARAYLQRERSDHTMQATSLVHEAYLRLVDQTAVSWQNRAHFLAVAAQQMRRILVDNARRHRTGKHGGEWCRVEFEDAVAPAVSRSVDVIALDDALQDLMALNPQHSRIVELRFFGGMTVEEVAEVLQLSPRTVHREWRLARAWLRRQVFGESSDDGSR